MEVSNNANTNENYTTSWKYISEKVEQILNPEIKTSMIFEPIYTRVYKNVIDGFSEKMHIDLITLCSRHLNQINQQLCSVDELSFDHLLSVSHHLSLYLKSIKNISSIFSYLNKFYVVYYLNADLYIQLGGLYNQIIIKQRLPYLMRIVEESYNVPFSIPPNVLHEFFNELNNISKGEYSTTYSHLFSKYCPNVLPAMKESDLEDHIMEVREFQERLRDASMETQETHGMKRPAEEQTTGQRPHYYYYRNSRTYPTTFH